MIEFLKSRGVPGVGQFEVGERVSEARIGKALAAQFISQGIAVEAKASPKLKVVTKQEGESE